MMAECNTNPRQFVLDASVASGWLLKDEQSHYGDAVAASLQAGRRAVVPSLFYAEITNVILIAERRQRTTASEVAAWLDSLYYLPFEVTSIQPHDMWNRVLKLGRKHQLSGYDACYLDIAHQHSLPIATQDKALQRAANDAAVALFDPFH